MIATKKQPTKKKKRRRAPASKPTIHQLKVTLRNSQPPIWRRFVVPSELTLSSLHTVLQAVMDWTNSHLHLFEVGGKTISDPDFGLDENQREPVLDEHTVELRHVAPKVGDKLVYEYDFGDSWQHDILVEEVRVYDGEAEPVWCIDGARACPPDDVGGMWGYEQLLEALGKRKHPEHERVMTWIGGSIDPEAFDTRAVNRELARWILSRDD